MRLIFILLLPCSLSAQFIFNNTDGNQGDPPCTPDDPVAELGAADYTYAWGSTINAGTGTASATSWDRANPAIFKATLNLASYTDGAIQGLGGSFAGTGVGFKTQSGVNGGSPFFYLHSGHGASTPDEFDVAYVTIDAATYFPIGQDVDLVWELQTGSLTSGVGYVRVWVDNELVAADTTSDASDLRNGRWSGSATGGWGAGIVSFGIYQVSGVADLNNSPTLEYWRDEKITQWEGCD